MKKIIVIGIFALMLGSAAPSFYANGMLYNSISAAESGSSMNQIHIILKKLQDAMTSMKDFDELESAGMPKKNVDRMRRAMDLKINQMMAEVITEIQKL